MGGGGRGKRRERKQWGKFDEYCTEELKKKEMHGRDEKEWMGGKEWVEASK